METAIHAHLALVPCFTWLQHAHLCLGTFVLPLLASEYLLPTGPAALCGAMLCGAWLRAHLLATSRPVARRIRYELCSFLHELADESAAAGHRGHRGRRRRWWSEHPPPVPAPGRYLPQVLLLGLMAGCEMQALVRVVGREWSAVAVFLILAAQATEWTLRAYLQLYALREQG